MEVRIGEGKGFLTFDSKILVCRLHFFSGFGSLLAC